MKVLHILSSNRFSGAENVACQIIDMFNSDSNLSMVYCSPDGPIRKVLNERNIRFHSISALSVGQVKTIIKQERPDIIHAHDMKASVISSLACGSIPLICHIHNNNPDSHKLSVKALLFLMAARKANMIFWVSPSAYEGYAYKDIISDKSRILTNIVDAGKIRQLAASDDAGHGYDVLFLGRLEYPKNPMRFVEIINLIRKEYPDIKAAMIGSGKDELPHSPSIDMLGFKSNPYGYLSKTKVLLMTSDWEGMPMAALEAMALGVPVVSTPVDGMNILIEDGVNGYLSNDNQNLADRVLTIIKEPSLQKSLSEGQLRKFKQANDIENYKRELAQAYGMQK